MKPIRFLECFVPQILDGVKTQTRRVVKDIEIRPGMSWPEWQSMLKLCPYGQPGDRIAIVRHHELLLEIVSVRVERLQDISEDDARAEGCAPVVHEDGTVDCGTRKTTFRALWESINGPDSWDANPFVWVVEFRRVEMTEGKP